jgi:type II secretory pathway pseudopilin PulG
MSSHALRRVIVVALLAAGCLVIVPGVAGAGVKAKYRSEYKARLKMLDTAFQGYVDAYGHNKNTCEQVADGMKDLLDDPDQLLVARQGCQKIYDTQKDGPDQSADAYAGMISRFRMNSARYFTSPAQQKQFKARCDQLKQYSGQAIRAGNFIYNAWKALAKDPPDFEFAAVNIGFGDNDLALGQQGHKTWAAKLKAML